MNGTCPACGQPTDPARMTMDVSGTMVCQSCALAARDVDHKAQDEQMVAMQKAVAKRLWFRMAVALALGLIGAAAIILYTELTGG